MWEDGGNRCSRLVEYSWVSIYKLSRRTKNTEAMIKTKWDVLTNLKIMGGWRAATNSHMNCPLLTSVQGWTWEEEASKEPTGVHWTVEWASVRTDTETIRSSSHTHGTLMQGSPEWTKVPRALQPLGTLRTDHPGFPLKTGHKLQVNF